MGFTGYRYTVADSREAAWVKQRTVQAQRSSLSVLHLSPRLAIFVDSAHSQILSSQELYVGDPQTDL